MKAFRFILWLVLTMGIWAAAYFLGYLGAARWQVWVLFLVLMVLGWGTGKCFFPKKLVTIFMVGLLVVWGLAVGSGFEESYCSIKAVRADVSGEEMVETRPLDKEMLKEFRMDDLPVVSLRFVEEMRCHENFEWKKALRDMIL